jgi:uncharacterized membrane protein
MLAYVGMGAALMYLFDPQQGRKRRNDLRNQVQATSRKVQRGTDAVVRDATNRTHGMLVETRHWLQAQKRRLERTEADAAGVTEALERRARAAAGPWGKSHWSPAQRAAGGVLGAGLATSGYVRGGFLGGVMCLGGLALIARAAANEELRALAKGKAFTVERTLRFEAPIERVFAFWRDFENFPRWMSHVREVRDLGNGRYHWVVDGPAGVPVEWDSELTQARDDAELAWRSVEGSTVDIGGRVRFESDGVGTRVHVELHYAPPGGAIGHAVAKAFGTDPASEMDHDLAQLRAQVEGGASARPPERRGDAGLGSAAA